MTLERSNELLIDIETALLEAIMDAVTSNTFDKTAKLVLAYKEFVISRNMRTNYNPYIATPMQTPQFTYTTTGTTHPNLGETFVGYNATLENHTNLINLDNNTTLTVTNSNE